MSFNAFNAKVFSSIRTATQLGIQEWFRYFAVDILPSMRVLSERMMTSFGASVAKGTFA